uniref:Uncharacterized protein n=1 Tax=Helianthus annuus TaxID=4232 RepID=A0A251URE0_HELAN
MSNYRCHRHYHHDGNLRLFHHRYYRYHHDGNLLHIYLMDRTYLVQVYLTMEIHRRWCFSL